MPTASCLYSKSTIWYCKALCVRKMRAGERRSEQGAQDDVIVPKQLSELDSGTTLALLFPCLESLKVPLAINIQQRSSRGLGPL